MLIKSKSELLSMSTEELIEHIEELQEQKRNTVVCTSREDVRFALSGMLSIPEDFISENIIDIAQRLMLGQFSFSNEHEQIMEFLEYSSDTNWLEEQGHYTGQILADDTLVIYCQNGAVDGSPDVHITSKDAVEYTLEHLFGKDWDNVVDETAPFTFPSHSLKDLNY